MKLFSEKYLNETESIALSKWKEYELIVWDDNEKESAET